MKHMFALTTAALLAGATVGQAQDSAPKLFIEGLAGAAVPTFDIADVATTGGALRCHDRLSPLTPLGAHGGIRLRHAQGQADRGG
jgi:hypothetical protein